MDRQAGSRSIRPSRRWRACSAATGWRASRGRSGVTMRDHAADQTPGLTTRRYRQAALPRQVQTGAGPAQHIIRTMPAIGVGERRSQRLHEIFITLAMLHGLFNRGQGDLVLGPPSVFTRGPPLKQSAAVHGLTLLPGPRQHLLTGTVRGFGDLPAQAPRLRQPAGLRTMHQQPAGPGRSGEPAQPRTPAPRQDRTTIEPAPAQPVGDGEGIEATISQAWTALIAPRLQFRFRDSQTRRQILERARRVRVAIARIEMHDQRPGAGPTSSCRASPSPRSSASASSSSVSGSRPWRQLRHSS